MIPERVAAEGMDRFRYVFFVTLNNVCMGGRIESFFLKKKKGIYGGDSAAAFLKGFLM